MKTAIITGASRGIGKAIVEDYNVTLISYMQNTSEERFGEVKKIARVARFLASNDASYITGTTIDVNRGYLMD